MDLANIYEKRSDWDAFLVFQQLFVPTAILLLKKTNTRAVLGILTYSIIAKGGIHTLMRDHFLEIHEGPSE
jgi:hypothetical protein